jgi:YHS domain-containing protein
LRIDRGRDDFFDEAVTDPVCGMRIARSAAVGKAVYAGHAYFFCSEECQQAFAANPQSFVEVKTLKASVFYGGGLFDGVDFQIVLEGCSSA